ncbi:GNAT family N-acetyltransferase [Rubinisphaera italica]|nr:GNAT family N-acetyltransferase [Rubinisphaera italica]
MKMRIAQLEDLSYLEHLEALCFPESRRSPRRSLRMSIQSASQIVMICETKAEEGPPQKVGAVILLNYKNSLRIYSLAIDPQFQSQGFGSLILEDVLAHARQHGYRRVSLEADSGNKKLIRFYERFGFEVTDTLPDYYAKGEPAVRMRKELFADDLPQVDERPNVIVLENAKHWPFEIPGTQVVLATTYLSSPRYQNSSLFRVFNLCCSFKPHKFGYYVSLLASARDQRVIPNVTALRDLSSVSLVQSVADDVEEAIQEHLKNVSGREFSLEVYFENTPAPGLSALAKLLAHQFELLLFRVKFVKEEDRWEIQQVQLLSLPNVIKEHAEEIETHAAKYFQRKRFHRARFKHFHYDLGILINPQEKTPPSCQEALHRMRTAAEKVGFYTEFITKQDYNRICEFDALFIRETTSVDHYTYRFSRRAYAEGLIVIDDPWSILRCSNKMYLYERLSRARVRQPRSWLICKETPEALNLDHFEFPIVLKLPDSCFSAGVFKVKDKSEMGEKLDLLFKTSEVVIAQEFLQTPFDWRIGVLDGSPLYACKYHMARGHWQIYNWSLTDKKDVEGDSETLALNQVPAHVLQTAVKGAALIGDGLYGVDLKEHQGKAYIIEINDNPNIDAGVEDAILQDDLYLQLMNSFYNRIERERKSPHFVSFRED